MALYDKPVKLLFKDMVNELGIDKSEIINRDQFFSWFKEKYPKIKNATISAHLLKMSINAPSRIHYSVNPNGDDDLLFQIDSKKFRLYDPLSDSDPIYRKTGGPGPVIEPEPTDAELYSVGSKTT